MALELRLNQKLDLQLKLAPQIIQSIEILQLPTIDLRNLVEQELDTNEFLEVLPPAEEDRPAEGPEPVAGAEPTGSVETEFDALEAQGFWDDEMPRFKSALDHEASDRKLEAMNNTAGPGPSLHEHLLSQFHMLELDEAMRALGEDLIVHVDSQGRLDLDYHRVLEDHPGADENDLERAVRLIQGLEPRGIAARSTEECLLLQLDRDDPHYELKIKLIDDHLEDLVKNRRPKIAKALGLELETLDELVHELVSLDFQPGRSAIEEEPCYIYPDIVVDWTPNGYEVRLANSNFPTLVVDENSAEKVVRDKNLPSEYRDQVRKQVDDARWLISAIEQRQNTLLRVARRIVSYQQDFLEFGPHYLRPLKMQQIADDLGIHVSTVSRATSEKYMQTHRGIFPMKFFFSGATKSVDGGVESRSSVKQRVKEIIDQEDKKNPLSDEEIVARLKENFGVDVARRTITKYRKALGIPSTRQRRQF